MLALSREPANGRCRSPSARSGYVGGTDGFSARAHAGHRIRPPDDVHEDGSSPGSDFRRFDRRHQGQSLKRRCAKW
jgi:hypothetical protein